MPKKSKNAGEMLRATVLLGVLLSVFAAIFWFIRQKPQAEHWWDQASRPETSSSAVRAERARRAERPKREARSERTHAEVRTEDSSEAAQRALGLIDQGKWNEAEALLKKSLAENPRDEHALLEMAMIQILDRKDNLAGQSFLQQALKVNPRNELVLQELLRTYAETKNWEQALNYFHSLPDDEQNPYVSYGLGTALLEMNHPAEAVEVLRRSIYEAGYQSFDAHETLAEALWSSGQTDEAMREYETLIQGPYKSTQVRIAKIRLAGAMVEKGQFAEARQLLQPLMEGEPRDEWVSYLWRQINEASN